MILDVTERKGLEEQLQQSEARLQSLYKTVPVGLAIMRERTIVTANEHFTKISGHPIEELNNKNSRFLYFSDEEYELVGKDLYGQIQSVGRGYVEAIFRHKNGSPRYVSLYAASLDPAHPQKGVAIAIQDITEQKAMIQALQDSEERFRQVSDFSGQLMYDYDVTSGNVEWYGRVKQITGFSSEEINGQGFDGWVERIHPDDRNRIIAAIEKAKGDRQSFKAHYLYCKADGSYFYAYEEGRFFYDQEENPHRMLGTLKDITTTKLAEIALKESELRYRTLFDGASDAIMILGRGVFVDCNQRTLDIFQCSRNDIIGTTPADFSPEKQPDGELSLNRVKELIDFAEGGESLQFDWVHQRLDNSTFFAEVSIQLVKLNGDKLLQAIVRDVTEKKEHEKSLRESEFRFRSFFDSNPEGILLLDFKGRILNANKSFLNSSGYTLDELHTATIEQLVPKKDIDEMTIALRDIKKEGRRKHSFESTYISKNGTTVPISITGWLITDETSSPLYLGVFIHDLTLERELTEEKRALEKQVIHAQKSEAIGTLASGIAHDFNNILGGIIGYTELSLFRDPAAIDGKTKEYLNQILKGSKRAKDLVLQILRFSKGADIIMKPINIAPLLKEALHLLRSTIPTTITIDENIRSTDDKVLGDASQFHQVVMNLATNAYHAMKETGGKLAITLKNSKLLSSKQFMNMIIPPGDYLVLTIADTGIGMSERVVERIFEPYFTTKNVNEGTGLGMSVVFGIIKDHQGLIEIETELGKGTTFTIYIPSYQGETQSDKMPELSCPHGSGQKLLIVDDESFFLEYLEENLSLLGYSVQATSSSSEALRIFRAAPTSFDLVITDQTMPEMTGVQLISEVRKINKTIPVILCTGFSEVVTEESASYYGIDHFLMKPVSLHDLGSSVQNALQKPE